MKGSISARCGPCIASWTNTIRFESGATSSVTRLSKAPSCWPPLPIRSGLGTSPSCLGPAKWTYFYLYVILDIFSRYVVGWMVASRESCHAGPKADPGNLCTSKALYRGQLTVHADRGSSMTSKPVALLLADLGVTKTHSRPHISNDNPFSEAHFKTLKYRPEFPDRFGSIQDARVFCQQFFSWYNTEHHHSGPRLADAP